MDHADEKCCRNFERNALLYLPFISKKIYALQIGRGNITILMFQMQSFNLRKLRYFNYFHSDLIRVPTMAAGSKQLDFCQRALLW